MAATGGRADGSGGFAGFDDAFAWLAARTNYETMAVQRYDARTYGLARVERLLASVGRPDRDLDVAQVVGSKGKGTAAAALASVLQASGRRVGLFTSPHLVDPRERIQVDGRWAEDALVVAALAALRPHVERAAARGEPATFFEIHTVAALLAFRDAGCDAAVLEAGMGARLDATTAAAARVKVLTSVSLDHVTQLGRTRAAIAREKCAGTQRGIPFVCGERLSTDAGEEARTACEGAAASLVALGRDFRVETAATGFDAEGRPRTTFRLAHRGHALALSVPLLGRHQAVNAALAAVAARVGAWSGPAVTDDAIRSGLAATRIPARAEVAASAPLVLVDGAHTPASFAALARTLRDALPERRVVAVVGMSADKDVKGSLRRLRGTAHEVVATASGQPRAASPGQVASAAGAAGIPAVVAPSVADALADARRRAGPDGVVVVTGSLYLCGDVLRLLRPGTGAVGPAA